ncbi:MAG TPA: DUF1289 domain-containing protein [Gammaproteobacteria bacterium]|nr:DUF1289 domain-containing protein [Gammaproteobacteria bacterium]
MSFVSDVAQPLGVSSPCIGVCRVAVHGCCAGCFRTLDEIAAWARLSDTERRRVLAELPARRARLAGVDEHD